MNNITGETTIGEVLRMDAGAAEILARYGMHCFGCPASQMEPLAMACQVHGMDSRDLIKELDAYFAAKQG